MAFLGGALVPLALAAVLGPVAPVASDHGRGSAPVPTYPEDPRLALPQGTIATVRASAAAERGGPIDTLSGVGRALRACWEAPPGEPTGAEVTVRLAFRRDGSVLGEPRITFYRGAREREAGERFRASVVAALRRCTPLPLTPAFGAAVAGRPFSIRFIDDRAA